jgi:hypothetical protein
MSDSGRGVVMRFQNPGFLGASGAGEVVELAMGEASQMRSIMRVGDASG